MFCNDCAIANELYACSGSLIVGTVEQANTDYYIFLENNSSNSTYRYEVTSDADGLITWTLPDVSPFAVGTPYTLWLTLATAEDRVTVTQGINTWTCITLTFRNLFDDEGCCVCPEVQTIIVKPEFIVPEPGCLCVTEEMLEGFVQSVTGPDVDNTDPQNPVVNSPTPSYQSYVANLQQSGTNAPVATVLNSGDSNFLGNIVWSYNSLGNYTGTLVGAFPDPSKVWMVIGPMKENITVIGRVPRLVYGSTDSVNIETYTITANVPNTSQPIDETLGGAFSLTEYTSIEIRVYP